MRRLTRVATSSGRSRATSSAAWPTTASPPSIRTALGVSISPSRLGRVVGRPRSSSAATAENVVPRSMPTTRAIWIGVFWILDFSADGATASSFAGSAVQSKIQNRQSKIGSLLVGRPDHHQAAVAAGHGALDEHQVLIGVDLDHGEVADGNARVAVLAGHADALLGAAAAAVAGVGGDRAALPRPLLDAVAVAQALEVVPLDRAREAAALGGADHVDVGVDLDFRFLVLLALDLLLDLLEHVGDRESGADLVLGGLVQSELADV